MTHLKSKSPLKSLVAMAFGVLVGAALILTGMNAPARADVTTAVATTIAEDLAESSLAGAGTSEEEAEEAQPYRRKKRRRRRRIRRRNDFRAGIFIGPDRFGIFLTERDYRRYRGRPRRDYYYRGRFGVHPYDRRFTRAGAWYVEPRFRRFVGRSCHPILKRGFYDGFRVLIRARRCYNRYGQPFIVRGSRRIVEYY
ncbi:MAG: hypothetical protein ACFB6R_11040 [Alphaproteobacteria bacterium]